MTLTAYIHSKHVRKDGSFDSLSSTRVDVREKPLWYHKQNLQFTRSGYGKRIPTVYMVRFNDRWRRVYCACFSNSGTLYIDSAYPEETLVVQIQEG